MSVVHYYQPKSSLEMTVSESAKARLLKVVATTEGAQAMRLSVRKTGCSGYSYDLQAVCETQETDLVFAECNLYVDANSYAFLKGVHIDYVKQGIQNKFVFTNPMQTGECGCGESFTIHQNS